jgi:hypothetical protein
MIVKGSVFVTILLSFQVTLFSYIGSYSRVIPDMPTELDSIYLETCNQISTETLIDSGITVSGNDIYLHYSAVEPSTAPYLIVRKQGIGKLPKGSYRLITTGYFIRNWSTTKDTTRISHDTVYFEVYPDTSTPSRIISYMFFADYPYVNETFPRRSFYCWNGDTLSIGMAFYAGGTGLKFFPMLRISSDTVVLDLIDTSVNQATMMCGYLTVTSLSPVSRSIRQVKIGEGSWGRAGKYLDPDFHHFTADTAAPGIGLSFRKPGRPEYVLYPNDTMYMAFPILSPFLDTLNILGFQPNPSYKPTGTNRIFLHDIHHGNTLIENWETYDKNDWHYVSVQESDRISFDTVSNSTNGDHWIRVTYSNENDEPVKGYYYKTFDQPRVSSLAQPFVGIYGAIKPGSGISPVVQQPSPAGGTRAAPVVEYTGAHITVRFSSGNPAKATVTDIRGRLVRVLDGKTLHKTGKGTVTVWDRRDFQGNPVPKGVYLIHADNLSGRNCAIITVR